MATLAVEGDELHLHLSRWEKLGALHSDIDVPVDRITDVDVVPAGFSVVRGLRMPGAGFPGLIALGTWRYRGGPDFVAVYRNRPAVVVTLRDSVYKRLIVSVDDPESVARELARV